jgi:uncharacterized protein involved in oxidation of intracellular sulfur
LRARTARASQRVLQRAGIAEWTRQRNTPIGACKTCLEHRGISDEMLLPSVKRSTLDELTEWTEEAEKVLTF